jgi:lysophospholipase L1-like esterase
MHPKDRDVIAFAGDSITAHVVAVSDAMESQELDLPAVGSQAVVDRHESRGWVALVSDRLKVTFPRLDLQLVNAGRGGDTSQLLLDRLESDVLARRPNWCLIAIGVNDVRRNLQVGRESERVDVHEYRSNLLESVRLLQEAGSRVLLLEPTSHSRPPTGSPPDTTVEEVNYATLTYAAAMRGVADECRIPLVPLLRPMLSLESRLKSSSPPRTLFADEVHLGPLGDTFYAGIVFDALLRTWGRSRPSGQDVLGSGGSDVDL